MPFGASKAARWQAYQTRARMGLNLWLQIITFVLIGWSLLTLLLIWHETGSLFSGAAARLFRSMDSERDHHTIAADPTCSDRA